MMKYILMLFVCCNASTTCIIMPRENWYADVVRPFNNPYLVQTNCYVGPIRKYMNRGKGSDGGYRNISFVQIFKQLRKQYYLYLSSFNLSDIEIF